MRYRFSEAEKRVGLVIPTLSDFNRPKLFHMKHSNEADYDGLRRPKCYSYRELS